MVYFFSSLTLIMHRNKCVLFSMVRNIYYTQPIHIVRKYVGWYLNIHNVHFQKHNFGKVSTRDWSFQHSRHHGRLAHRTNFSQQFDPSLVEWSLWNDFPNNIFTFNILFLSPSLSCLVAAIILLRKHGANIVRAIFQKYFNQCGGV